MYPLILWKDRMALGQNQHPDPQGDFFFVRDFPLPRRETTWDCFPPSLTVQPQKIVPLPPPPLQQNLSPLTEEYLPSYPAWKILVELAQQDPSLQKVLLARRTSYTFATKLDPLALFFALREIPNSHPFAFILSPTVAWVGATPELLYRKKGKELASEALAATRPLCEEHLLWEEKEQAEFAYVQDTLAAQLQQIAHPFALSTTRQIKRTQTLAHLHYPFQVTLKEELSDEELIAFLHPTPAIGGFPREEALRFLQRHEPFDRGWYAGCIGHKKGVSTEVYVAIRSGIVAEKKLHLFSGAGITAASAPAAEWQELNQKLAHFTFLRDALL